MEKFLFAYMSKSKCILTLNLKVRVIKRNHKQKNKKLEYSVEKEEKTYI